MISPPRWARERLDQQRLKALARFIEERKQSQTAEYLQEFEAYRRQVSDLFDITQDLTAFSSTTVKEGRLLDVARFLAVPPWSRDDLATVSGAKTPHKGRLMEEQLDAVVFVLERSWDPARFPWLAERRRPTTAEREVALRWTASIGAIERMRTKMRMSGSRRSKRQSKLCSRLRDMHVADGSSEFLHSTTFPSGRRAPRPTSRLVSLTNAYLPSSARFLTAA